jgi:hypothetical protein
MAPAINYTRRSPNYNDRPPYTPIDSIVVHTTEGVWPTDLDWLCNPASGVSCHYVLAPDGTIYSIVDDACRAWHAGQSSYAGRSDYNNFSIGIEVSHKQNYAYNPAQHPALTALCKHLIATYPINRTYIVQHRQVAPDRKIDMTNVSNEQFENWANAFYVPASRRYQVTAPCAVFQSRAPDAPLADGMDDGQTQLMPGDYMNVGDIRDGWLWVSPNEHDPPGIGFIPSSYARPA